MRHEAEADMNNIFSLLGIISFAALCYAYWEAKRSVT